MYELQSFHPITMNQSENKNTHNHSFINKTIQCQLVMVYLTLNWPSQKQREREKTWSKDESICVTYILSESKIKPAINNFKDTLKLWAKNELHNNTWGYTLTRVLYNKKNDIRKSAVYHTRKKEWYITFHLNHIQMKCCKVKAEEIISGRKCNKQKSYYFFSSEGWKKAKVFCGFVDAENLCEGLVFFICRRTKRYYFIWKMKTKALLCN